MNVKEELDEIEKKINWAIKDSARILELYRLSRDEYR
jgi:hypothetical protein